MYFVYIAKPGFPVTIYILANIGHSYILMQYIKRINIVITPPIALTLKMAIASYISFVAHAAVCIAIDQYIILNNIAK